MQTDDRTTSILYEYGFKNDNYVRTFSPLTSEQLSRFEKSYGNCIDINKFTEEIMIDKAELRIQKKL